MRVITGTARGMRLRALEGQDVRPTTDKVKESIFNIVQFEVENAYVLDLFAGSGQLGIEALSRGARGAVFVDNSKASSSIVKENLEYTKLSKSAIVKTEDSLSFLRMTKDKFDLCFLDPPYNKEIITQALPLLVPHMSPSGTIVCETSSVEELPEAVDSFIKYREYKYGKIKLTVYKSEDDD